MDNIKIDAPKTPEADIEKQKVERSKNRTCCVINAAFTVNSIYNYDLHVPTIAREFIENNINIVNGNLREIEMMLITQAQTLDALFHRMTIQAMNSDMINRLQAFSDIALRAQNQSRKTLVALADLKSPRRATFIKQQNNAVNQQVNNNLKTENLKKTEKLATELLSEVTYEKMDAGRKSQAIRDNAQTAAVEILHRA